MTQLIIVGTVCFLIGAAAMACSAAYWTVSKDRYVGQRIRETEDKLFQTEHLLCSMIGACGGIALCECDKCESYRELLRDMFQRHEVNFKVESVPHV